MVIYEIFERSGRIFRPSAGHYIRLHEPALKTADRCHHRDKERSRAYHRPGYGPELLPRAGAVDLRGLVKFPRDALERGKEEDHIVAANHHPQAHYHERRLCPRNRRGPRYAVCMYADGLAGVYYERIQQAEVGIIYPCPQKAYRDAVGDGGQEKDRLEKAYPSHLVIYDQRKKKGRHYLYRDYHHEVKGVAETFPEERVVGEPRAGFFMKA